MAKVSIIIPARNEEATLNAVLTDVKETIGKIPAHAFEIIVVDDHSSDRTSVIAGALGARVIANARSSGKGHALRAGFEAANGDIMIMMDADYSHRAEEIPLFLEAVSKNGVGLVIGSRIVGGSEEYTPVRAFGNVVLSLAVGLFMKRFLSDALNGYKAFRRDVFTNFQYTSRNFEIEVELIANALRQGYQIVEVCSHERQRAGGQAKSRVIRHGTLFLARIVLESYKGIKPKLVSHPPWKSG